jgi:hypothetical protein
MVTSLDRSEAILLYSLWQLCLRNNKTREDDLSKKTVPRDDKGQKFAFGWVEYTNNKEVCQAKRRG